MSNTRHNHFVLAGMFITGALGVLVWMLVEEPDKSSPGRLEGHTATRAAEPMLDTAYRPTPRPTEEHPDENLRPDLIELLQAATPLARRIEILDGIKPDLTEIEAMAILQELSAIPPREENSATHSTYIHKVCNLLQLAPAVRDDFANALATVAANRGLPIVYRDYAFQHLRILWRGSLAEDSTGGQARMRAIENTFRGLLAQRPETAAQSLLGLHEIRQPSGAPVVADEEISRLATGILDVPPAADSIPARMTAVRILAERRISANSNQLRAIATSDVEHSLVRASAVAALGFIGDPADLEFLETLPTDDPLIAGALRHAVNRQ